MATKLVSSKARIRDAKTVRAILDAREMVRVEFRLVKKGKGSVLDATFEGQDPGARARPAAVCLDELRAQMGYAHKDAWVEAVDHALGAKGGEGFLALLRELAPHLETDLLILSASHAEGRCWAEVWYVRPGAKDVQHLKVDSL
jgi:hypothetical protein